MVNVTHNGQDDDSLQRMSNAFNAIPLHYMDHITATVQERRDHYHKHCHKSFCKFHQVSPEEQEAFKPTDRKGNPCDNELYVEAMGGEKIMQDIIKLFVKLGHTSVMRRCTRFLNQNVNESIHARLYYIVSKIKHYSRVRLCFAAERVLLVHNHGHFRGSLYHKWDCFSDEEIRILKSQDADMLRKAQTTKKKRTAKPMLNDEDVNYCSGFGFEDHPPLLDVDEFDERDHNAWHTVPGPDTVPVEEVSSESDDDEPD